MEIAVKQRRVTSVVALMLTILTAPGHAQTKFALATLNVPDSNLPDDCRLRPVVPPTQTVGRGGTVTVVGMWGSYYPFPSNPWLGSERRLLIELRKGIDGGPPVPDGPPLSNSEMKGWESRWVEHVVEGYRALYDSETNLAADVLAIRFDDAGLATPASSGSFTRASRANDRFVLGDLAVRVVGNAKSACFQAVESYIRALKR
jgi:hypothetical protein